MDDGDVIPKPHEFISFASSSFGLNGLTCAFLSCLCISAIYLNMFVLMISAFYKKKLSSYSDPNPGPENS